MNLRTFHNCHHAHACRSPVQQPSITCMSLSFVACDGTTNLTQLIDNLIDRRVVRSHSSQVECPWCRLMTSMIAIVRSYARTSYCVTTRNNSLGIQLTMTMANKCCHCNDTIRAAIGSGATIAAACSDATIGSVIM